MRIARKFGIYSQSTKPTSFVYNKHSIVTTTGTTTISITTTGWYRIIVIGKGGNGGAGADGAYIESPESIRSGGGGGGGASGGCCIHLVRLTSGNSLSVYYNSNASIGGITVTLPDSSTLYAPNGNNGGNASSSSITGGSAGAAKNTTAGGNILNIASLAGYSGSSGTSKSNLGTGWTLINGGKGGGTRLSVDSLYMLGTAKEGGAGGVPDYSDSPPGDPGPSGDYSSTAPGLILGNAGAGGGGNGWRYYGESGGGASLIIPDKFYSKLEASAGSGGTGRSGGVVLELGVY